MSDAISLSPVDVAALPSLSDLFAGELELAWQRELCRVMWNIHDPSVPPEAERHVTLQISFTPDADRASAVYKLEKLDAKLAGAAVPQSSRMIFRREAESLRAVLRPGQARAGIPPVTPTVPRVDTDRLPGLSMLWGGLLDDRWRRELVAVLLNIDDPRSEAARKRSITIRIAFRADAERGAVSYWLKTITSKLAPCKAPDASTLYLEQEGETLLVEMDPSAFLPSKSGSKSGEPIKARQTNFDPNAN